MNLGWSHIDLDFEKMFKNYFKSVNHSYLILQTYFWTSFRQDFSESSYSNEQKMGLENVFHQLPFENGEAEEGRMVKIREVLLDFLENV